MPGRFEDPNPRLGAEVIVDRHCLPSAACNTTRLALVHVLDDGHKSAPTADCESAASSSGVSISTPGLG